MESLFDSIRVAIAAGASDAERARGAIACRSIAAHLESGPAPEPAPPAASASVATTTPTVALAVPTTAPNPFAGVSAEQLLDLVIAKLGHAPGASAPAKPVVQGLQIQLVPVPRVTR